MAAGHQGSDPFSGPFFSGPFSDRLRKELLEQTTERRTGHQAFRMRPRPQIASPHAYPI